MDHLFTPWRYSYVSRSKADAHEPCILCRLAAADPGEDQQHFVLHRAQHHYLVLNSYPYATGHLMIVPYLHAAKLADLEPAALCELSLLAARAQTLLEQVYQPEGLNLGMNIGRCAGAGLADHLHLHAVPRWCGDTNFMAVTGETRVLPEDLDQTWRRLHGRF